MTARPAIQEERVDPNLRRLTTDRGSGLVAGVALMFAFTFLGLIWMAGTVDRGISNQTAATSIAFQAARSGAQAALIDEVRAGNTEKLDAPAARAAATSTANALLSSYGVTGSIDSILIDDDTSTVTVTISIIDGSTTVTGSGAAEAVEVT